MELFQKDKRRLRGSCAVTGGSDDLTAKLGTDIAGGENARNIGAHFGVGNNKALSVTLDLGGQELRRGFIAHIDKQSVHRQLAFLAGFQSLDGKAGQRLVPMVEGP